jgi:dolichol kinase
MKWFTENGIHQFFSTAMPIQLPNRNNLHLARKAWHMAMGTFICSVYLSGISVSLGVLILAAFLALTLSVEAARLRIPAFNERIVKIWSPLMRSCEVNRVTGIPYYILACLLAVAIFPKPVAILSILYLAFGDPFASIFGILFGAKSIRFASGKSLIGTLGGIGACTIAGLIYLNTLDMPPAQVIGISLIGGIVGGCAELLPLDTDDNFSIPMVSGFTLWLIFILFGI